MVGAMKLAGVGANHRMYYNNVYFILQLLSSRKSHIIMCF